MGKRDVDVTIRGKNQAKPAFKDAGGDVDSFGKKLSGLLNPVNLVKTALASLGAIGFTALARSAVKAASESEAAWGRVESAVESAGLTFRRFQGELDELFTSIQKTTRYSDDQAADAFTELMTITQDYAGSVKNLSLVTNLAAAKQIDLQTAAQLVGRAMVGQTSTLSRYGIIIKDGADAITELSKRFAGFAERDAESMQGQLLQVANAWDNVLESMGRAILGMGGASETTAGLASTLNSLATWIDANRSGLNDFASGLENIWKWLNKITGVGSILSGVVEGYDKLFAVIAMGAGFDPGGGPEDAGDGQYYKDLGRIRARARARAQAELQAQKDAQADQAARDAQAAITKKGTGQKFRSVEGGGQRYDREGEDILLRMSGFDSMIADKESEFRIDPKMLEAIAAGVENVKVSFDDLGMSINNVKTNAMMALADTWSDAVESIVTGSSKAGKAIGTAIRKGVGSGMMAEGRQNILAAAAIAVKGFFNPVDWGRAAKLFGIGSTQIATGALFAGGGGGGGSAGAGGIGAGGVAQQQNEVGGRGGFTLIIDGKEFDTSDPRVEESLAAALRDVLGRNVVVIPAGG